MASIRQRPDGVWRARYRDEAGKEHARHFTTKREGQRWLDEVTASLVSGTKHTCGDCCCGTGTASSGSGAMLSMRGS